MDPAAAVHAAIERGGEPRALLRRCVESLVPSYADGCEVDLQGRGEILRIVAGLDRSSADERERSPVPADDAEHPIVAVLRGGAARLLDLEDPEDEPLFGPADQPSTARALGITTAVLAPIVVDGAVVGSLALGRGPSGRRFGKGDLAVVIDLARRIGLAWHNAVLLAERASILASLHDGLIVSDRDGVVLEVNERWCHMSGFTEAECVGARPPYPWWPDVAVDAVAHGELGVYMNAALRDTRLEAQVVLRRADGTRMPSLLSVAPVVDRATGEHRALVASVKDLTDWEAAEADLASLQRVTARLAAARDVAEVVEATLAEVVARTAADTAFVFWLGEDGQRLELLGGEGAVPEWLGSVGSFGVERTVPASVAVRDGTTVVVRTADELAERFPDLARDPDRSGSASIVSTPIRRDGEALGALSLWSKRPAAFGRGEVLFLEAVAVQCGQALQRAEGFEVERRTSHALQRRLLSDVPLLHPRATIATRYQAAAADVAVGGDWYDVITLAPDRLAVVVGDVVGSGVEAAAVMGQLRSALKGIALVVHEPVAVLEALDQVALGVAGAGGATVCYCALDLAAGELRLTRAGHPPPLLVPADGGAARFLEGHADPPLGMGSRRREAHLPFVAGDLLLLYTDGLVERRDAGLTDRLDLLQASATAADRTSVELFVDDVLAACVPDGNLRDDLAVLAVRDEPAGPNRYRALLPASGKELAGLRRSLRAWLDEIGMPDREADDLVLATSEAATNSIEHAYRDVFGARAMISVTAAAAADGAVRVEVRDAGRWKARPSETTRGRGLSIVRSLLGEVDVRTGPSGTTVAFGVSPSG